MQIKEMNIEDIDLVLPLYMEYYNKYEDGCWTEVTAKKRIKQVLTIDDSFSLIKKGLGSFLLAALESKIKEAGASCMELQAVSDEMHERFYGKAGFANARNFVLKVKWFE